MLVWLSAAIARASRVNRSVNWAFEILIATSRFSRESWARYTSPIPPLPMGAMISYGPSLSPVLSGIGVDQVYRNRGIYRTKQDRPILLTVPETMYLKYLVLKVMES